MMTVERLFVIVVVVLLGSIEVVGVSGVSTLIVVILGLLWVVLLTVLVGIQLLHGPVASTTDESEFDETHFDRLMYLKVLGKSVV